MAEKVSIAGTSEDKRNKLSDQQWEDAYDAWVLVHKPKGELTQKSYASNLGVSDTWLSNRFSMIERERDIKYVKTKMPKVMKKALDNVEEALSNSDIEADTQAKLSLETFKAISDREGISPATAVINVQATANAQSVSALIIPPLFGKEDEDDFKQMMGGVIEHED